MLLLTGIFFTWKTHGVVSLQRTRMTCGSNPKPWDWQSSVLPAYVTGSKSRLRVHVSSPNAQALCITHLITGTHYLIIPSHNLILQRDYLNFITCHYYIINVSQLMTHYQYLSSKSHKWYVLTIPYLIMWQHCPISHIK